MFCALVIWNLLKLEHIKFFYQILPILLLVTAKDQYDIV